MISSLIPPTEFVGINSVTHLATGGESPMLRTHLDAVQQFMIDKGKGEPSRNLQANVMESAREQSARLLKVSPSEITFLSSATEGINIVAFGLGWEAGDNVVVADVEFPSDILPWTRLKNLGVEIRIVRHRNWVIDEQDVLDQIDDKTRVVAISQVSMFTGQHMDVPRLSQGVRQSNALFLLDITHAAGVVPVDASLTDIAVSSCYKWLLGTHGTAIFYCNKARLPDFEPPFLGWASVASSGGWKDPLNFTVHDNADRFLPANPSYLSIYILDNALRTLMALGESNIHEHALRLSQQVLEGVEELGLELMTPAEDHRRAGNVCFMSSEVEAVRSRLHQQDVLIWGAYGQFGRVRISTHVYNSSDDVDRFLTAMK